MKDILSLQMQLNRRNFFGSSGLRFGGLAAGLLAGQSQIPKLFADPGRSQDKVHPALARAASLRTKSQIDHLFAHERSSIPDRYLGLQTRLAGVLRQRSTTERSRWTETFNHDQRSDPIPGMPRNLNTSKRASVGCGRTSNSFRTRAKSSMISP